MTRGNPHLNGWIKLSSLWGWLGLSVALLLAACGGGGGDGGTAVIATPVSISQQPVSVAAVVGSSAVFAVAAAGDGLVYQWQVSQDKGTTWTDIPGAVSATYTVQAVTPDLNGYMFRVKVGAGGGLTSSAVTLTATAATTPAAITVQPVAQSVVIGGSATFAVTANGTALSYRWQLSLDLVSWTDIAGATNATLVLSNLTAADNGKNVRVIVSNAAGSVTSAPTPLTVTTPAVAAAITTQPVAASVVAPQTATFTVVATGSPAPTYQWQVSANSGAAYADIASATAASYTTPATTAADTGKLFRVRVSNSVASVTSSAVALTVAAAGVAPSVVRDPAAATVYTPFTGTFAVVAGGSPTPAYQWQISTDGGSTFANVNGATAASYTTPATASTDASKNLQYRAVVTNSAGSAVSHPATMTVVNSGMGGYIQGVAIDANGNLYASVMPGGTGSVLPDARATFYGIKKLDTNGVVTALAGSATEGHSDGTGSAATFYSPFGIAVDATGNVYVADWGVNAIRKVSPTGVVTTLAGGDIQGGFVNGVGTQASFNQPYAVAVDGSGNVYVTDRLNSAVRKIAPSGQVSTFAGGTGGTADGTGTAAKFSFPLSIACDSLGNVYVTDGAAIRKISPAGVVTTVATTNTPGMSAKDTGLGYFVGIAVDGDFNLYVKVIDATLTNSGYSVRKISPAGLVSTPPGATGLAGSYSFAVDGMGNIYAADYATLATLNAPFEIRKITPAGASIDVP